MRQRDQRLAQYRFGVPVMLRRGFLAVVAAGLALFALEPGAEAASETDGTVMYAGALPSRILVIDENEGKVVDEILLSAGVPRRLRLSYDKKKIYVFTANSGIAVVDLATRKVINEFSLHEGNRRVRIRGGYAPDPQDRLLYTIVRVAIQQVDRFEVEKPKFAVIDLAQQQITRTVDLPEDEPRLGRGAGLRVSPDGKYLYAFQDNVLVFDTEDFKLVEKIELSKPLYPGMEQITSDRVMTRTKIEEPYSGCSIRPIRSYAAPFSDSPGSTSTSGRSTSHRWVPLPPGALWVCGSHRTARRATPWLSKEKSVIAGPSFGCWT